MKTTVYQLKLVSGLKIRQKIDFLCSLLMQEFKFSPEKDAFLTNIKTPMLNDDIDVLFLESVIDGILGYAVYLLEHCPSNSDEFVKNSVKELYITVGNSNNVPKLIKYKTYLN